MARRVTPSQYASMVRQAQAKQRQAISKLNNAIDKHNREVRQQAARYNHEVDRYNREVRAHNARVRGNRQRLISALNNLERETRTPNRIAYTVRSSSVYSFYQTLEQRSNAGLYGDQYNEALDLAEREAANSVELESALQAEPQDVNDESQLVPDEALAEKLAAIQSDLPDRWRGALFALSPRNPDAARHFCTSAREIFIQIFDVSAPDSLVKSRMPQCELTQQGSPTRKSKIDFMLQRSDLSDSALSDFIEEDVSNILSLFRVFNDGTHGTAGRYGMSQLKMIKQRVENGLQFLARFAST